MAHTKEELADLQALPLDLKVSLTKQRVREWVREYGIDGVYISFSGGKDSTVLLDIVRSVYGNDIPAVFVDTGLEFPEIRKFVKTFDNLEIVRPKLAFNQVVIKYGYPILSKEISDVIDGARNGIEKGEYNFRLKKLGVEVGEYNTIANPKYNYVIKKSIYDNSKYKPVIDFPFKISSYCCNVMKKNPVHKYGKETGRKAITGQQANESMLRKQKWLQNGCNAFNSKNPTSNPMSFWTEQDVLRYIKEKNLIIPNVYGKIICEGIDGNEYYNCFDNCKFKTTGCDRTGCMFCAFGLHLEKGKTRFQKLKETHPKQYDYCINGGHWVVENGKEIWTPDGNGLGMGKVFDTFNEVYGEKFMRYK